MKGQFIQKGIRQIEMDNWLKAELPGAGFIGAETIKTPMVTRVVINVSKPGLVIGKKGANIKRLTLEIEKRFKIDNPAIEIKEIDRPEVNAKAMVDHMKNMIERGFSWRSVGFRSIRDMVRGGALGIELRFRGALTGRGNRKMKHRISEGYMKKVGHEAELVDYAKDAAITKAGAIGIKLRIVRPGTVFIDKLDPKEALNKGKVIAPEVQEETKEESK